MGGYFYLLVDQKFRCRWGAGVLLSGKLCAPLGPVTTTLVPGMESEAVSNLRQGNASLFPRGAGVVLPGKNLTSRFPTSPLLDLFHEAASFYRH